MTSSPRLSLRINSRNPDHHLWLNNGTWFIHYVVHEGPYKRRVRESLGTKSRRIARERRDAALRHLSCCGVPGSN